jgi:hypothetical protein
MGKKGNSKGGGHRSGNGGSGNGGNGNGNGGGGGGGAGQGNSKPAVAAASVSVSTSASTSASASASVSHSSSSQASKSKGREAAAGAGVGVGAAGTSKSASKSSTAASKVAPTGSNLKQLKKQADAFVDRGIKLLDSDGRDEARSLFEKAISLLPNHQNAHYNIVALLVEDLDDDFEYDEASFDDMINRTKRAIMKFDDVIKLDTSNRGEITGLAHRAKASSLYHNWIILLTKHSELFPGRMPCGSIDVRASIEEAFIEACEHFDSAINILRTCQDLDECIYEKAQCQKRFAIYLRYQYESEAKYQSSTALVQHEEFLPEKFSKILELWVAASNSFCASLQTEFSSGIDSQIILSHGECLQTFWDFLFSCPAFKQFLFLPPSQPSSSSTTVSPLNRFITMYLSEAGREDINLETLRSRTESICSLIVSICSAEADNKRNHSSVATLVSCDLKQCLLKLSVVDSSYFNNPVATVKFLCELLIERTDILMHIIDELVETGTIVSLDNVPQNDFTVCSASTESDRRIQEPVAEDNDDDSYDENEVTVDENLGILGDAFCDISRIFPVLFNDFVKSKRSEQVSNQFDPMLIRTTVHLRKAIDRIKKYCQIDWEVDPIDELVAAAEGPRSGEAFVATESKEPVLNCEINNVSHIDILYICRQHTLLVGRCSLCVSIRLLERSIQDSQGNPLELAENQSFLRENAFNLACVCWQLGDKSGCRKAIESINDLKNELVIELLNDSDLAGILEEPWFGQLVKGVDKS